MHRFSTSLLTTAHFKGVGEGPGSEVPWAILQGESWKPPPCSHHSQKALCPGILQSTQSTTTTTTTTLSLPGWPLGKEATRWWTLSPRDPVHSHGKWYFTLWGFLHRSSSYQIWNKLWFLMMLRARRWNENFQVTQSGLVPSLLAYLTRCPSEHKSTTNNLSLRRSIQSPPRPDSEPAASAQPAQTSSHQAHEYEVSGQTIEQLNSDQIWKFQK